MNKVEAFQRLSDRRGRNYRRYELEFPVRLRLKLGAGGSEIETVSKNVSIGGLLVRSAQPLPENTSVTFILSVHGKQSLRPVHLLGEGRIVRVEAGDVEGTFAIAVQCDALVTQLEQYFPMQYNS